MRGCNIALVVVALAVIYSTVAAAGIVGSVHDFTPSGVNIPIEGGTGRICVVCHTPHNALLAGQAPLWNHTVTTATFTLYDSGTLDSTPGSPDGTSLLCLSCHDDTVALDAWQGNPNFLNLHMTGHRIILGTDISDDHPISFDYTAALAVSDGELRAPSSASGLGGTIASDLLDESGKLQCNSCHDTHNSQNNGNYLQPRYGLLWTRNEGSSLCLTCHIK